MTCHYLPLATLAALMTAALPAHALTLVNNPTQLNADDALDFSTVSPTNAQIPNPVVGTSTGGITVTARDTEGDFLAVQPDPTFVRNFGPNDTLVGTQAFAPISLGFSETLAGFGTQVSTPHFGEYSVKIEAFDAQGASLGDFTVPAYNDNAGTDTAPFVGVRDDDGRISSILITTFDSNDNVDGVYISDLVLAGAAGTPGTPVIPTPPETPPTTPGQPGTPGTPGTPGAPIPEPASAGLLALAIAALGIRCRRHKA